MDIFLSSVFFLSLIWETARYRLKYCLEGPLNPKQPTNQKQTGAVGSVTSNCRGVSLKGDIALKNFTHEVSLQIPQ